MADPAVKVDVVTQLGDIKGSVGEIKGLLVGIKDSLQAGSARMDNHETRIRSVEQALARYSVYAAAIGTVGGAILTVVVQLIASQLF